MFYEFQEKVDTDSRFFAQTVLELVPSHFAETKKKENTVNYYTARSFWENPFNLDKISNMFSWFLETFYINNSSNLEF